MELVSMTCQKCGGKLKVAQDANQIICLHCGAEFLISRNEDTLSIKLLSETMEQVQSINEKLLVEAKISRLREEEIELWRKSYQIYTHIIGSTTMGGLGISFEFSDEMHLLRRDTRGQFTCHPRLLALVTPKALDVVKSKFIKDQKVIEFLQQSIRDSESLVRRLDEIVLELAQLRGNI